MALGLAFLGWIVALGGVVRTGMARGCEIRKVSADVRASEASLNRASGSHQAPPPPRAQAALDARGVNGSTLGFIWWGVVRLGAAILTHFVEVYFYNNSLPMCMCGNTAINGCMHIRAQCQTASLPTPPLAQWFEFFVIALIIIATFTSVKMVSNVNYTFLGMVCCVSWGVA